MAFSIETRVPYTGTPLPSFGSIVGSNNLVFALRPSSEFSVRNLAGYKPVNYTNNFVFKNNIATTQSNLSSTFSFDDVDVISPDVTMFMIARVPTPSGVEGTNDGLIMSHRYNGSLSDFVAFRYTGGETQIRYGNYAQSVVTGVLAGGATSVSISPNIKDTDYVAIAVILDSTTRIATILVKSLNIRFSETKSSNYNWGKRTPDNFPIRSKTVEVGGNADQVEVLEVLQWDKVLTEGQIEEQYQLSKKYVKARGIDISNWF